MMGPLHISLLVLGLAACSNGADGPGMVLPLTRPTVAAELSVPENHRLVAIGDAKGVQIYECAAGAGGALAWKLHAPRADLFDGGGVLIATHFGGVDKNLPAGPYWEAKDKSRVHGGKPASVPNPGSIPLLRLDALDGS
jgi:hypothetical protein